jgi:hypothetical protein
MIFAFILGLKSRLDTGAGTPRADISQMANMAVSHRSWAVDMKHGQTEGQKTGHSTPREERAQTARNRPRKATWGRTAGRKPRGSC